nr:hypothetical protein [Tanacetum cinerariifolium]
MRLERHEEQIDAILNHLDELSLERIEHMEDKIEGKKPSGLMLPPQLKIIGIHVDPAKTKAVKNWASPTTHTEKNKKYIWGENQESAFQLIKQKLCEAPILALPEENKDFVVYCDASHQDYDCEIRYHPGKANVIADALSQKERIKPL